MKKWLFCALIVSILTGLIITQAFTEEPPKMPEKIPPVVIITSPGSDLLTNKQEIEIDTAYRCGVKTDQARPSPGGMPERAFLEKLEIQYAGQTFSWENEEAKQSGKVEFKACPGEEGTQKIKVYGWWQGKKHEIKTASRTVTVDRTAPEAVKISECILTRGTLKQDSTVEITRRELTVQAPVGLDVTFADFTADRKYILNKKHWKLENSMLTFKVHGLAPGKTELTVSVFDKAMNRACTKIVIKRLAGQWGAK